MKENPAFELRRVCVVDEFVEARPIQWDGKDYTGDGRDQDGRLIQPTMYVTTCPKCGNMIQFGKDDILEEGDRDSIGCPNCHAGEQDVQDAKEGAISKDIAKAYEKPEEPKEEPDAAPEPQEPEEPKEEQKKPPEEPQRYGPPVCPGCEKASEDHQECVEGKQYSWDCTCGKSWAAIIHEKAWRIVQQIEIEGFEDPIKAGLM